MSELRSQLQDDILTAAPWDALRPHAENILVVRGIPLLDAGEALADDDVAQVKAWLADGTLARASDTDLAVWEAEKPTFVALIVQPWILVQRAVDT